MYFERYSSFNFEVREQVNITKIIVLFSKYYSFSIPQLEIDFDSISLKINLLPPPRILEIGNITIWSFSKVLFCIQISLMADDFRNTLYLEFRNLSKEWNIFEPITKTCTHLAFENCVVFHLNQWLEFLSRQNLH